MGTTVLDDVFHSPWPMDLDDLSATKHKRDLRLFTSVYHIKSRPIFGVLTHAQNIWDLGGSFSHDKLNRKTKSEDSDSAGWRPGMTCRCSNPIPGIQTIPKLFPIHKEIQIHSTRFSFGKIAATLGRSLWVVGLDTLAHLQVLFPRWLSPNLFCGQRAWRESPLVTPVSH